LDLRLLDHGLPSLKLDVIVTVALSRPPKKTVEAETAGGS
jgi:hypothetical protein